MAYRFNSIWGKLVKSSVLSSYIKQGLKEFKLSENTQIKDSSGYIYNNLHKSSTTSQKSLRYNEIQTELPVQNGVVRNIVYNGPSEIKVFAYKLIKNKEGAYYNPRVKEVQAKFAEQAAKGVPIYFWAGTRDYIAFGIYVALLVCILSNALYVLYSFVHR
ncbi:unnamed protein product [Gordionus sp. m RMFG-2023]|uniref:uncharacterized protein LOC135924719 n=1 Tax=Gordionus sp. m RMFG-2023 TaxID=3053472 RepID=UPI0030E5AA21